VCVALTLSVAMLVVWALVWFVQPAEAAVRAEHDTGRFAHKDGWFYTKSTGGDVFTFTDRFGRSCTAFVGRYESHGGLALDCDWRQAS
jgi:hypothetical protein